MQRRVSVHHLFVMVPILGIVVAASRAIRDSSFLWHVRAGTHQLDLGSVIRVDPFSFTARQNNGPHGIRMRSSHDILFLP